jgi:hypothetical protein
MKALIQFGSNKSKLWYDVFTPGDHVARVYVKGGSPDAHQAAQQRAALLAATPEMHAALRALVTEVSEIHQKRLLALLADIDATAKALATSMGPVGGK